MKHSPLFWDFFFPLGACLVGTLCILNLYIFFSPFEFLFGLFGTWHIWISVFLWPSEMINFTTFCTRLGTRRVFWQFFCANYNCKMGTFSLQVFIEICWNCAIFPFGNCRERPENVLRDQRLSYMYSTAPYIHPTQDTRLFGLPSSPLIIWLTIKLILLWKRSI